MIIKLNFYQFNGIIDGKYKPFVKLNLLFGLYRVGIEPITFSIVLLYTRTFIV